MMSIFPVATFPALDESLQGFVARACDENGHPAVAHALGLAGFKTFGARFLSNSEAVDTQKLSAFFGCREDELRHRFHLPVEVEGSSSSFVDYFGQPIRKNMREPILRRVSPASLRLSPHHRGSWMLRPLHYCPESGEKLVSSCPNPNCGRSLGWNTTYGIPFCEYCLDKDCEPTTDLRNFSQPMLEEQDFNIYAPVARLLTDSSSRDKTVPDCFSTWKGWEIFDLVAMLAVFLFRRLGDRTGLRGGQIFQLDGWHENFMLAARAVMDWPNGMGAVVELMREGAGSRAGYYGLRKELGPLADFGVDYGATPQVVAEVNAATKSFYASNGRTKPGTSYEALENAHSRLLSYREAVRKPGVTPTYLTSIVKHNDIEVVQADGAKHAPVFFNESELNQLLKERSELRPLDRLPVITGLPMFVVHGLVQSGHICVAKGAVARFRSASVRPSEIEKLEARLRANGIELDAHNTKPLLKAIRDTCVGGKNLLPLFRLCLDGDLQHSMSEGSVPLLSRIMVREEDLIASISRISDRSIRAPDKMSRRDVSIYLDVDVDDIIGLVQVGLLKTTPAEGGGMLVGKSVDDFAEKYTSTHYVARRLKFATRSVRKSLARLCIEPAAIFQSANRTEAYAWRKKDLARYLT
jgi:hypothetical protein